MNALPGSPQDSDTSPLKKPKKRSGIPTGNAGEYFVMGELLRRGFDAQMADRNTKGYDVLVGSHNADGLVKVQVKTVRSAPWYVKASQLGQPGITIYVLLGSEKATKPVRFFIARNVDLAAHIQHPSAWKENGFMSMAAVAPHEGRWDILSVAN